MENREPCSGYPAPSNKTTPSVLRSSVSMFIEDSRITAVANAEPPPRLPVLSPLSSSTGAGGGMLVPRRPSYFSVTSYTSSSSTSGGGGGGGALGGGSNLNYRTPSPRACSSSPVRFPGRELFHSIIREDDTQQRQGRGRSLQQVPPPQQPPPSNTSRRRSTLSVEPVLGFGSELRQALPSIREDRAYTSVNLTLRTPAGACDSSGDGGGTVISSAVNLAVQGQGGATFCHNVSSTASGSGGVGEVEYREEEGASGTNLMYSSYSNSRDGFEAQVQIQFGPGGGTFTACRRRRIQDVGVGGGGNSGPVTTSTTTTTTTSHNISIRQQMGRDLLSAQTERKEKLRVTIQDRKCLLAKLQTEIGHLRSQLLFRGSSSELEKLKQENQRLRIECNYMSRQVDLYQNGSVPLGETNEAFYQGINPGQSLNALFGITNNRRKVGGPGGQPPPRPPPPKFLQSPTREQQQREQGKGEEELPEGEWRCSMCTFQNHRDLDFCEQCQMVRVKQPQHHHHPQVPHQYAQAPYGHQHQQYHSPN